MGSCEGLGEGRGRGVCNGDKYRFDGRESVKGKWREGGMGDR